MTHILVTKYYVEKSGTHICRIDSLLGNGQNSDVSCTFYFFQFEILDPYYAWERSIEPFLIAKSSLISNCFIRRL